MITVLKKCRGKKKNNSKEMFPDIPSGYIWMVRLNVIFPLLSGSVNPSFPGVY